MAFQEGSVVETDQGTFELRNNQWTPIQQQVSPLTPLEGARQEFQQRTQAGFDPLRTLLTGAMAEPVAGLAGIAGLPFGAEQGTQNVESVRQALTSSPQSQAGAEALQRFAETMSPVTETMQTIQKGAGDIGYELAGPIGGAIGETLPTAVATAFGMKFRHQSPTKQRIGKLIEEKSGDISTAKFKLKPTTKLDKYLSTGAPKIAKDKIAVEAIKQGFDEGVIASIKGASPTDKRLMAKMANIMEKGKKNARFSLTNRPSDVAGDSLMKRLSTVQKANTSAGKRLDSVAKGLKGKPVDSTPIGTKFIDDLNNMGVQVTDDLQLNFRGSDIEGLAGPERVITHVFNRMRNGVPDAYELHRLKRFIDEQVTYGKNAEGLAGKSEQILKGLRRNIDETLDRNFPRYDKINTQYSETIGALDSIQDVAGKRMDFTGPNAEKAVGTLMRRLMSNAQSRVNLLDAVNDLEAMAVKHGGKFNDDLLTQVLFVDELDSVFGPSARTSFQGQIGQAVERVAARPSVGEVAVSAAAKAAEKIRGINQEGAFKAIKLLLKEQ